MSSPDSAVIGAIYAAAVRGSDSVADMLPDTTRAYLDNLRAVGLTPREVADYTLKFHQRIGAAVKASVVSTKALRAVKASGLALKSIQSTRLDFEDAVEQLLLQAVKGNVSKLTFQNRMMQLIRGYGFQAYRDGLKDGGVKDAELDADDTAQAERLAQEQRQYVRGIAEAIYQDDRVTEDEARGKPQMWWNKSVYGFYLMGIESASKNAAMMWVLGRTEKHCVSCKALDGQVRRIRFWLQTIMPKSIALACKGFRCDCRVVPTDEPISRGALPRWAAA